MAAGKGHMGMRIQVGTVGYEVVFSSELLYFNRCEVMCICDHEPRRISVSGRAGAERLGRIWSRLVPAIMKYHGLSGQSEVCQSVEPPQAIELVGGECGHDRLLFNGSVSDDVPVLDQSGSTAMRLNQSGDYPKSYRLAADRLFQMLCRFTEHCGEMTLAGLYHAVLDELAVAIGADGSCFVSQTGGWSGEGVFIGHSGMLSGDLSDDRIGNMQWVQGIYGELSRYQLLYLPQVILSGQCGLSGGCIKCMSEEGIFGLLVLGVWSGNLPRGHVVLSFSEPGHRLADHDIYLVWMAGQILAGFAMLPLAGTC